MPTVAKPARKTPRAKAGPQSGLSALVVAGMHRSGTSALARVLSLAGGSLPERVMDPGPDNPLGFWEPWEMVGLNDSILASVGSRWDDVFGHRVGPAVWARRGEFEADARGFIAANFGAADHAVLKDPRASLMMRFWDAVLTAEGRTPVHVIMVRHPLEVAASIAARGQGNEAASALAWTACMLAVERDTRGTARLFVDYDDLLENWRGVLARVEAALGHALPKRAAGQDAEIDAFLSASHRHHRATEAELAARSDLWPGVLETWRWMTASARGAEPDGVSLDRLVATLEAHAAVAEPALAALQAEVEGVPALTAELVDAKKENTALRTMADQFHAEADHNGRHWEASKHQVALLGHELNLARVEAERARHEATRVLPLRNEIAQAEARVLRQQARNRELSEALERDRLEARAHAEHGDTVRHGMAVEIARLEAELAEARRTPAPADAPKSGGLGFLGKRGR